MSHTPWSDPAGHSVNNPALIGSITFDVSALIAEGLIDPEFETPGFGLVAIQAIIELDHAMVPGLTLSSRSKDKSTRGLLVEGRLYRSTTRPGYSHHGLLSVAGRNPRKILAQYAAKRASNGHHQLEIFLP